jgi:predicted RNase H-like HicB family nuclease
MPTVGEVRKRLFAEGWYRLPRKATSHEQYKHPYKPGKGDVVRKGLRSRSARRVEGYSKAGRMVMSRYAVVIEKTPTGFSAYVPDLPGCIGTGQTVAEIEERMLKGIELHLTAMREDGDPIPEPTTLVRELEIA